METDKVAILFNPSAGKGIARRCKSRVEELLQRDDIPYDLFVTKSEKDLVRLTGEKCKEYQVLVGAGGDSTFNIMINEIFRRSADVTFGMIGLGSSNDIMKEFGIDSLEKAFDHADHFVSHNQHFRGTDHPHVEIPHIMDQIDPAEGLGKA